MKSSVATLFFLGLPIAANWLLRWAQKTTIDHTADSQSITIRIKS